MSTPEVRATSGFPHTFSTPVVREMTPEERRATAQRVRASLLADGGSAGAFQPGMPVARSTRSATLADLPGHRLP
jgi:hypothetical protein